jgi:hypothetical protein
MTLSHAPVHVTYIDWRELWLEQFCVLDIVIHNMRCHVSCV